MKKEMWIRMLALLLVGLMVIGVLLSAVLSVAYAEGDGTACELGCRTSYAIRARMLAQEQVIRCEQTTVWHNDTDGKLSQLFFACYPNALRRESTAPFDSADFALAFPEGYAPGGIQFASIEVNGEPAVWGVQGEDESFLRVAVDLLPGESAEIAMAYDILLPVCGGFAGAGSFDWRLTNAFPTVCALEGDVFRTNGALTTGWFAFADAADWELELVGPEGWQVIGSGEQSREDLDGGLVRWTLRADAARDMAVVIGRRYTEYISRTDERIAVWCNDRSAAQAALQTAQRVLALYEDWFGPYPWPRLNIVMSQYALGTKSAPGVLLLNKDLFALAERKELEYNVALLTAKQYFGELVGVDPYGEPWLSESVSGMAAMLYYGETYGENRLLSELRARVQPSLLLTIPGGVAADSSAAYFNSRNEYEIVLRGRGVAALYELMRVMGKVEMLAALRMYVADNARGEGTIEKFVRACDAESGGRWGLYLVDMLSGIGSDMNQTEWY